MSEMELKFDSKQQFQLDAVSAVTDIFDGQPQGESEYSVIDLGSWGGLLSGQESSELGVSNQLLLADELLRDNTRKIQLANDIEVADPDDPLESWHLFDIPVDQERQCPHFSVEMETGTGKTYVYLRTIFELSQRYRFQKFVIVVPSVAIREGVLKNIEITRTHFLTLYNNLPFEHFVYDAKKVNRLRQFATSNTLQVMVINIDSFRKQFSDEEAGKSNVIYKESDKLSGRQPIDFVQATRPIVIIDEPQSVDSTAKSQEAIKALNPLCTLRYSATHRNPYNLVYRLDPVRAFELKLVKQIVVASATGEGGGSDAYVKLENVDNRNGIKAKLRIHQQTDSGPKEKSFTVKQGADLFQLSDERDAYSAGFEVSEINAEPGIEYVEFANGHRLSLGQEIGGMQDDLWRAQIKHTIKRHLDKEVALRGREPAVKVLSLFFIDRVANYRDYDDHGQLTTGKFAKAFEAEFVELAKLPAYKDIPWMSEPISRLHNGYFAQDKKGSFKDTKGDTQADDDVYSLIMKDKERLLSIGEPLRFIFSHSALREGWDNPNVFQICTLNETRSAMKKRQEIGRGLRLPVDQDGNRVFDDTINRLFVMANESYDDFARALQTEYEEDCGVTFGKVPVAALARLSRVVDGEERLIGLDAAAEIMEALKSQGVLDSDGRITDEFAPKDKGFQLDLPAKHADLASAIVTKISEYQMERHIRRARDEKANHIKNDVLHGPELEGLWNQIKLKTRYRVEFDTNKLVDAVVDEIKNQMPKIEKPKIVVNVATLKTTRAGVEAALAASPQEEVETRQPMPDVLSYMQSQTELTRSTLMRILKDCGRLQEIFNDPQRFMDSVVTVIRRVLQHKMIDGIKYEPIPGGEWQMSQFEEEEVVNVLSAVGVDHSLYEYVEYDSDVERQFAEALDEREDIKLFLKLPRWFKVETPVGTYNPDWAILKDDGEPLYLVRETKATKDYMQLRDIESLKIRCGKQHFDTLDVDYDVATAVSEIH
jgi:type III restriction enzyme